MEKFIIELKDLSKRNFLLELLAQLDFIDFKAEKEEILHQKEEEQYDLFQSAGLFKDRNVDATQLRKEAWRVPN